jgi:hypothetical protein
MDVFTVYNFRQYIFNNDYMLISLLIGFSGIIKILRTLQRFLIKKILLK